MPVKKDFANLIPTPLLIHLPSSDRLCTPGRYFSFLTKKPVLPVISEAHSRIGNSWVHRHMFFTELSFYATYGADLSVFANPMLAEYEQELLVYLQRTCTRDARQDASLVKRGRYDLGVAIEGKTSYAF